MYLLVDIETGESWPIDLDWVEENINELEAGAFFNLLSKLLARIALLEDRYGI